MIRLGNFIPGSRDLVGEEGFEPPVFRVSGDCFTTKLHAEEREIVESSLIIAEVSQFYVTSLWTWGELNSRPELVNTVHLHRIVYLSYRQRASISTTLFDEPQTKKRLSLFFINT